MATLELQEGNSSYVQIVLTNPIDGAFINDATVTGQILDASDSVVESTFAMPYVTASDGVYRATVAPNVLIVNGSTYKVIIDSTTPESLIGHWECTVKATGDCC